MIAALEAWSGSCEGVLGEIEQQIAVIQANAVAARREQLDYEKAVEDKRKAGEKDGPGGGKQGKRMMEQVDMSGGMMGGMGNFGGYGGMGGMMGGGGGGMGGGGIQSYDDEMDLDDGPFDDYSQGGARKTRKGGTRMFGRKR